ncbi:hypothetical protein T484DRAFT_2438491 [Baffinella frigidus]|nr:hypothetical protein T484DRAFT_2438491 [Cryptophyta sp. CCMP2293]
MMRTSLAGCLAAALCVAHVSADSSRGLAAFASPALPSLGGLRHARACKANVGLKMGMEQLEFIIHPDGRVEEKVIGIKGGQVPPILSLQPSWLAPPAACPALAGATGAGPSWVPAGATSQPAGA